MTGTIGEVDDEPPLPAWVAVLELLRLPLPALDEPACASALSPATGGVRAGFIGSLPLHAPNTTRMVHRLKADLCMVPP
jgi:hypothetical protein